MHLGRGQVSRGTKHKSDPSFCLCGLSQGDPQHPASVFSSVGGADSFPLPHRESVQGRAHSEQASQNNAAPAKPRWQAALSRVTFHRQDQAVLGFEPSARSYQHRPAVTTASWPRALPSVQIWAGAPCQLPACCATDGKCVPRPARPRFPETPKTRKLGMTSSLTIPQISGLGSVAPFLQEALQSF